MEIGEVTEACVLISFITVFLYARIVDKQMNMVYKEVYDLREDLLRRT
jgi:hypothetical protein